MYEFDSNAVKLLRDFYDYSLDKELQRIIQPTIDLIQYKQERQRQSNQLKVRQAIDREVQPLIELIESYGKLIEYIKNLSYSVMEKADQAQLFEQATENFYLNFDSLNIDPQIKQFLYKSISVKLFQKYYSKSNDLKKENEQLRNEIKRLRGCEILV
ncbi:MAG: hypothetical protein MK226_22930 [Saprospiraceae bacterium]|nr:hypothetical protein [Saprospiraceae bacterium]